MIKKFLLFLFIFCPCKVNVSFIKTLYLRCQRLVRERTDIVKDALQKSDFINVCSVDPIQGNVFCVKDAKKRYKFVVKMVEKEDNYTREIFCSKFAHRSQLSDVIMPNSPLQSDFSEYKLIVTPYCHFKTKESSWSLRDAAHHAKRKNYLINREKNQLWSYDFKKKEYVFPFLDQLNFEQALVFRFLILHLDLHKDNVLLQMNLEGHMKIKFIDFSYSMSEMTNDELRNVENAQKKEIRDTVKVQPCCILNGKYFKNQLEQFPSSQLKQLINNIKNTNFDDLFCDFNENIREIDKKSFFENRK